jgi:hypothetical protein
MKITVRPDFKSLIPPLKAEERALQKESIQREGQRMPIILWVRPGVEERIVLDGHNRIDILIELGIPEFEWKVQPLQPVPQSDDEAIAWMLSDQLGRRNLTDDMRKVMAARLYQVQAKVSIALRNVAAREKAPRAGALPVGENHPHVSSREQAAISSGISENKLRPAIELLQKNPDLADKVGSGTLSLSKARERAGLTKPKDKAKSEIKPKKSNDVLKPVAQLETKPEPSNLAIERLRRLEVQLDLKSGESIEDAVTTLLQIKATTRPVSLLERQPYSLADHNRVVKQFQDELAKRDVLLAEKDVKIADLTAVLNMRDRKVLEAGRNDPENSPHFDMGSSEGPINGKTVNGSELNVTLQRRT